MQISNSMKLTTLLLLLITSAACAPQPSVNIADVSMSRASKDAPLDVPPDYDDIRPVVPVTPVEPSVPADTGSDVAYSDDDIPTVCAEGSVCFAGRRLNFKNDIGNPVSVSIAAYSSNGFTATFRTIAQRTVAFSFTISGGQLIPAALAGQRAQVCYRHDLDPCLVMPTPVGNDQYNCASALHWTGDYTGNTKATQVICPGQG